jgi:hypothetical protein
MVLFEIFIAGIGYLVWRRHDKKKKRRAQWAQSQNHQVYNDPRDIDDPYKGYGNPPPYEGGQVKRQSSAAPTYDGYGYRGEEGNGYRGEDGYGAPSSQTGRQAGYDDGYYNTKGRSGTNDQGYYGQGSRAY